MNTRAMSAISVAMLIVGSGCSLAGPLSEWETSYLTEVRRTPWQTDCCQATHHLLSDHPHTSPGVIVRAMDSLSGERHVEARLGILDGVMAHLDYEHNDVPKATIQAVVERACSDPSRTVRGCAFDTLLLRFEGIDAEQILLRLRDHPRAEIRSDAASELQSLAKQHGEAEQHGRRISSEGAASAPPNESSP